MLSALISSCNKEETISAAKSDVKKSLNPNGDSELAILMREMYTEAEKIKEQIEKGEVITTSLKHEEILSAEATEAGKVSSDAYIAFANVHVQNMNNFQIADPSKMLVLYENMVNNCINCHKEVCPGPLKRIEKLRIASKDSE